MEKTLNILSIQKVLLVIIKNFIGHFLHGLKLKSYNFKKYKTKKEKRLININIFGKKNNISVKDQLKFKALRGRNFLCKRFSFRTR